VKIWKWAEVNKTTEELKNKIFSTQRRSKRLRGRWQQSMGKRKPLRKRNPNFKDKLLFAQRNNW